MPDESDEPLVQELEFQIDNVIEAIETVKHTFTNKHVLYADYLIIW